MKQVRILAGFAAALAMAGCGKSPQSADATPEPEQKNGHPVVHVPPVETRPFEDGYAAGFEFGKIQATPHTPMPSEEEARRVAHERSGSQPQPTERWERGFAQGYSDGVRNVVTGQK